MDTTPRPIEERRSTVKCLRPGWLQVITPPEQRDRPDMDLTFRSETVSSYGIFYSYDHPATLGIMVYVKDGKFTIENMPIAEFNAAMEEAEA